MCEAIDGLGDDSNRAVTAGSAPLLAAEHPAVQHHRAESGDLLVLGWGSTAGSIASAVEVAQAKGKKVSALHLRHVWPLPKGLDASFARFKTVLVPEMNLGQMARILRSEYAGVNFVSYPKVQGQPFRTAELVAKIDELLQAKR